MSVLVIVERDESGLLTATRHTIAAALELNTEIHLLLAGGGDADAAAKIEGVTKVLTADAAHYAHGLPENLAPLVVKLAGAYSHLLAPSTTFGKNLMPRVAALLDVAQISDAIKIVSEDVFMRPIYAGNAIATVQSSDKIKVLTVRTTAFRAVSEEGGSASIEAVEATEESALARFVGQELSKTERPELTSARIIISGGRGMQSGENFKLLEAIADRLGAAIGASRAAVDAGYVPNDYQVGQTGKIVAPELYIAVGISGAIQHLAGMKDSKVIAAINKDEEAPIFQIADYGLVEDLFKALPDLAEELDKVL